MIDLYTVPLGATARDFFSAEAENKYSYDEALLVLPSRLLVNHARRSGRAQAVNFEYLPNRIVALNRQLLDLPPEVKLEMISRRTQELLVVIFCTSWLNCRAWTILVNWQIKKVSLKLLPGFWVNFHAVGRHRKKLLRRCWNGNSAILPM